MLHHRKIATAFATTIFATTLGLAHAKNTQTEKFIPLTQAAEIAQKLHPQGTLEKVALDRELTRTIYEVEIKINATEKYEVEIDAKTGDVLRNDRDH